MIVWMDVEGIMLSKVSQTKEHIPNEFTQMWNKKNRRKINKQSKTEPSIQRTR